MILLDGKKVASELNDALRSLVQSDKEYGIEHSLAIVQVGGDPASNVYVNNKKRVCEYIGIKPIIKKLDEDSCFEDVAEVIKELNDDCDVNGIIVQLPLPKKNFDDYLTQELVDLIYPCKDVDCLTRYNIGKLHSSTGNVLDRPSLPCTPSGIMKLLNYYDINVAGKNCVVVGRSNIVGKPMASMLTNADATVTLCHSKTKNLKEICKQADILICAIGKPKFFNEEYVKNGAVVIDVGINRMDNGKLCGDVDFDAVKDKVYAITPCPGGCGPMTITSLMHNVVLAKYIA